ncbi:unnamed protein product, partial [Ectocarpus sp. 12 AP-2014]
VQQPTASQTAAGKRRRQLLLGRSSQRSRLQWPLLRALAAALVYLATATGAAAASTTPAARLRLNGSGSSSQQRGSSRPAAAGSGVGVPRGRHQERRQQSGTREGDGSGLVGPSPSYWGSRRGGGGGGRRSGSRRDAAAAVALSSSRGVGLAFLPMISGLGAQRGRREQQRSCLPPLRALRAESAAAAAGRRRVWRPRRGPAAVATRALTEDG